MQRSPFFEELVVRSWWAILFFLLCLFLYDQAAKRREEEADRLRTKLHQLLAAKEEALLKQEDLIRNIASQKDVSWVELILMEKLGLVPDGQTKVHFVVK